jgi:hypothetical protein
MKKLSMLIVAIILVAGMTTTVMAQTGATATTDAGAVIITPIALAQVTPLHFGVMSVKTGDPGTCVLSTVGVRTATGGVNLSAQAPAATNAAYTVAGQISTTYALTLPLTITVTRVSGSETMLIGTLVARFNLTGPDKVTSTLNPSGADSFTVGGTLSVAAAQVAGVYAGTFAVTVAYN